MKTCFLAATLAAVAYAQPTVAAPAAGALPYYAAGRAAFNPYGARAFNPYGARAFNPYGARFAGAGYGYPVGPKYVDKIVEVPAEIPEPVRTNPTKTLAAMDQFLTLKMFGGLAGPNVAQNYVYDGTNMVKSNGQSDFMTMMMLSQGLGGTGNNQLALYNLLQRKESQRFISAPGAAVTVGGNVFNDYTNAPDNGNSLMSMIWGGVGGSGLSAGAQLPILMYGGDFGPNPIDGAELMSVGVLASGSW